MPTYRSGVFLSALLLTFLAGCSPIRLAARDPADTLREFRQDIISSRTLSPVSLQALKMAGLTQDQVLKEGVTAEEMLEFERFADPIDKSYIESEVAIGRAQLLEKSTPERAVALYLHAADMAWQGFSLPQCQHPVDLRCDSFKVFYDRAVRGALEYFTKRAWDEAGAPQFNTSFGRTFTLRLAQGGQFETPSHYDTLVPASSITLEGLTNRHRRPGVGVALTGCRARRDDSLKERYLPKVGTCLPLTAVIRFPTGGCSGAACDATVEIFNAFNVTSVKEGASELPLSADFTAPFASIIDKTGVGGWDGLFDALGGNDDLLRNTGFYTLEPYKSDKIPLITVHGLFSNPLTWMDVHNDLMGDAAIRERYQVWHYLYPTSLPIIENTLTFRDKLDELHTYLTEDGATKTPGMVIISHSMGGILTRTAVVTNSDAMRQYLFENPDKLKQLPEDVRKEIEPYVNFSRKPYIDRVIFVAVPHRGSDIADNWIGRIGRALMSLPRTVLVKTASLAKGARNLIKPSLQSEFDDDDPSSIRGLSTRNPTLIGLSLNPIDPAVPYHSIIGDRGKGDGVDSSDGIVAYKSSHLDGAQSESIVPADHTAHAHPKAVQEIRRILRLHLGLAGNN
jgi:hypothetical protein